MSGLPFGDGYASHYDQFYAEKDYAAECDLIEEAWRRYGRPGAGAARGRLLDVGCGTGGHAVELARRGWDVCGVDRSSAMLARARQKAERAGVTISFVEADAQHFVAPGTFDVALLMFAVIGYLGDADGVAEALANIRRHIAADGLLMFDCWHGPAVVAQRPGDRVRIFEGAEGRTTRHASGTLDEGRQLVSVRYRVVDSAGEGAGERTVAETEELHTMRYFFAGELRALLGRGGFEPLSLSAFPSLAAPLTDEDWNAFVVARAR